MRGFNLTVPEVDGRVLSYEEQIQCLMHDIRTLRDTIVDLEARVKALEEQNNP